MNNISTAAHHAAGEGYAPPPEPVVPPGEGRQLSRPAELIVAGAVALCLTATLVHVASVFLFVAPSNTVSRLYQRQINAWVYPYFEQDWKLFAPNPQSARQQISARASMTASDGTPRPGDWVDLTAVDDAAVRHDFFPSHTAQNMLRRAWAAYADAQGADGQVSSPRALMLQEYLRNIAVQRISAHSHTTFNAVQLRVTSTPIPPPGGADQPAAPAPAPSIRLLPWWSVTSHER
ncbi:hypothetical protein ABH935_001464 [Catenulispora sp. GAS73]|uniref:DUF5819 family protein n=1 Tax=Catenulispora sp. GAS73 TaxID=3156269 RepID=UPI0035198A72